MIFCNHTSSALYFPSATAIPDAVWKELQVSENPYFTIDYLTALEENNAHIEFSYIVILDDAQKAIALALIKVVDFSTELLESSLEKGLTKLQCLSRQFFSKRQQTLKLLVCGNTFVSGEHGIFIKEQHDQKQVFNALSKAIVSLVNENKHLKKTVSAYLVKDFRNESLHNANQLYGASYYSFLVEPNMVLTIDPSWRTFDDYLAAMKTKFRVKANKASKQSVGLTVQEVTSENIAEQLPAMTALYKKVASKAAFNLGEFNLKTYVALKKKLGDRYLLKTYWLDNVIVGFLSGLRTNDSLDAHFVGIDYAFNKSHAIYQRMLYDYIETAIAYRVQTLNFGRTASEIKSSVGAIPQDLTCYMRHKKSIANRFLKPFIQYIEPTPFQQKLPFKAKKDTLKTAVV